MNKSKFLVVIAILAAFSTMAFSPVTSGLNSAPDLPVNAGFSITAQTTSGLTPEEVSGLLKMREEEKLAHDVYVYLYELWGQNSFNNIAASEQTHADEVKVLLDAYSLTDPSAGKAAGEFTDPALQKLYNDLTAQGSQSLEEALKVGAAIEEIDILDLREQVKNTSSVDIQTVYQNLENGSNNHLRAYTGVYERQTGETYQPQYLSESDYQAIIQSTNGNGNGTGIGTDGDHGLGTGTGNGTGMGGGPASGSGTGTGAGHRGGRQ